MNVVLTMPLNFLTELKKMFKSRENESLLIILWMIMLKWQKYFEMYLKKLSYAGNWFKS